MAAATAAQIKTALSRVLKFAASVPLPTYYDDLCAIAETFGYQEVVGKLVARGYRQTEDVDAWDRLYEFTLELGLWKALSLSGSYDEEVKSLLATLDRREELLTVAVFVNKVFVRPGADQAGTPAYGGPINQASGVFRYDETDETDLGIPI